MFLVCYIDADMIKSAAREAVNAMRESKTNPPKKLPSLPEGSFMFPVPVCRTEMSCAEKTNMI